jgi:excinuclease ABC subunit A
MHDESVYAERALRAGARGYVMKQEPRNVLIAAIRDIILYGSGKEKIHFYYLTENGRKQQETHSFEGIIPNLTRRYKETESQTVREELAKYLNAQTCPDCQGTRLCQAARHVHVAGQAIYQISAFPLKKAKQFFDHLELSGHKQSIAERIIKEISNRLQFLNNVGLDYLSLDRSADTLSGGESQRIRLASQIGSGLTGVMYVLDEPSIGLHQRDNDRLLNTLKKLRDLGNSVIVVEHDQDVAAIRIENMTSSRSPPINRLGRFPD